MSKFYEMIKEKYPECFDAAFEGVDGSCLMQGINLNEGQKIYLAWDMLGSLRKKGLLNESNKEK